jgi:hypothetical protein
MASDVTVAPTLGHAVLMTQGGIGSSPGYDAIDLRRMIQSASGGQEGVFDALGWKVTEASGGANMTVLVDADVGLARVDGESVVNQGPYIVAPHSTNITLDVATANATNPRIDTVILHVRDNTHDALGSNDARVRILSGTATSGATLDNRTGAAALPSNAILLADVLVPATDTTISNAQIRDRRKWAHGAHKRMFRADTTEYTTTSLSMVAVDTTRFQARVECSGAPLRFLLNCTTRNSVTAGITAVGVWQDGALMDGMSLGFVYPSVTGSATAHPATGMWQTVPSAGSHLFTLAYKTVTAATATLFAAAGQPLLLAVEEVVRPDADNGTA